MKIKFVCAFGLLVLVLAGTSAHAHSGNLKLKKQSLGHRAIGSFDDAGKAVRKVIRLNVGNFPGPDMPGHDDPKIRQAADATMNASTVPVTQSVLAIIAVFHLLVDGDSPSTGAFTPNRLHGILFRVIISPNGP